MLSIQLKNLHIMNIPVIYMKPQGRTDKMKALDSGRSRIDYKHAAPLCIPYNLKDMRVAANEDVRPIPLDQLTCLGVISSWISAYMGHQDLHPFTFEETMKRMSEAQIIIVTVSGNTQKRLIRCYLLSKLKSSPEISGMPDLIHRFKEFTKPVIEYAMCI